MALEGITEEELKAEICKAFREYYKLVEELTIYNDEDIRNSNKNVRELINKNQLDVMEKSLVIVEAGAKFIALSDLYTKYFPGGETDNPERTRICENVRNYCESTRGRFIRLLERSMD